MNWLLTTFWRAIRGRPQWALLWLAHAKFNVTVTGIVRNGQGEVLLLRHRFWGRGSWGLPGGFANRSETLAAALQREVMEETGQTIEVGSVVRVNSGFRLRLEVCLLAMVTGGNFQRESSEVLEARFFQLGDLPPGLTRSHRKWIELYGQRPMNSGGIDAGVMSADRRSAL